MLALAHNNNNSVSVTMNSAETWHHPAVD